MKKFLIFLALAAPISVFAIVCPHHGELSLFNANVEALTRSEGTMPVKKQPHAHVCGSMVIMDGGLVTHCTELVIECYGKGQGCTPKHCHIHEENL